MLLDWSRRRLRISAATLVSCWSRVAMAGDYAMRGKGTIVRRRKAVENSPTQHRFAGGDLSPHRATFFLHRDGGTEGCRWYL